MKTESSKMDAELKFKFLETICNQVRKVKKFASHFQFFSVGV